MPGTVAGPRMLHVRSGPDGRRYHRYDREALRALVRVVRHGSQVHPLRCDSIYVQIWECLKNALPRIERPHFSHRRTIRACFRRGTIRPDAASPAVGTQSIELLSHSRVSQERPSCSMKDP